MPYTNTRSNNNGVLELLYHSKRISARKQAVEILKKLSSYIEKTKTILTRELKVRTQRQTAGLVTLVVYGEEAICP